MRIGGDDISNDVSSIFHVFFNVFFTFALVSASRLLAESWHLSRRRAKEELACARLSDSIVGTY